ncbi:MAG: plasmid mobilization protein [Thainema sp.]
MVKRNNRIPVRVTPDEKATIQSSASAIGTNVSRMLRVLGLKAKELHQLIVLIRRITARLLRLKSLSYRRQVNPDEIRSAVDGALEPLHAIEKSLQSPPGSEAHEKRKSTEP